MKTYGIVKLNLEEIEKGLKESTFDYEYVYKSNKMSDVAHWIIDNKATDQEYSIEIYEVDEDGELLNGSDYDSPSNFLKRRAFQIRMISGLSQAAFSEKYRIPKRTIETWEATAESAKRNAPEYVLDLLERAVREDFNIL